MRLKKGEFQEKTEAGNFYPPGNRRVEKRTGLDCHAAEDRAEATQ